MTRTTSLRETLETAISQGTRFYNSAGLRVFTVREIVRAMDGGRDVRMENDGPSVRSLNADAISGAVFDRPAKTETPVDPLQAQLDVINAADRLARAQAKLEAAITRDIA